MELPDLDSTSEEAPLTELLSTSERVVRLDDAGQPDDTGVVLHWWIGAPAGSVQAYGLCRWADGSFEVVNIADLRGVPEE